jgi:hypothetical protein
MHMTVARLQEALEHFLSAGTLNPDCIVGFAHPEQDEDDKLKVYPINCEKLAIVGNAPGCPPMLVKTGGSRD